MSKQDIKFMHKIATPRIRKRDGETITHVIHIGMTTEEALLLSQYFEHRRSISDPAVSLIRAFLLQQSLDAIDENKLIELMAAMQLKKSLAAELSNKDYCRAIDFIKNPPAAKKPEPVPVKPARREYIPEPRRR